MRNMLDFKAKCARKAWCCTKEVKQNESRHESTHRYHAREKQWVPYQQNNKQNVHLTFLVLDLLLHILNGVRGLNLQGDGLASQGLHKDLHATTQAQHQVQCGLLLDVVVSQGAAILQLLAGKDETLLVWGDTCT